MGRAPRQGGGHWFEPSIAHLETLALAGVSAFGGLVRLLARARPVREAGLARPALDHSGALLAVVAWVVIAVIDIAHALGAESARGRGVAGRCQPPATAPTRRSRSVSSFQAPTDARRYEVEGRLRMTIPSAPSRSRVASGSSSSHDTSVVSPRGATVRPRSRRRSASVAACAIARAYTVSQP